MAEKTLYKITRGQYSRRERSGESNNFVIYNRENPNVYLTEKEAERLKGRIGLSKTTTVVDPFILSDEEKQALQNLTDQANAPDEAEIFSEQPDELPVALTDDGPIELDKPAPTNRKQRRARK